MSGQHDAMIFPGMSRDTPPLKTNRADIVEGRVEARCAAVTLIVTASRKYLTARAYGQPDKPAGSPFR
ncbi:MAG: hypothetical protein LZF60_220053 [Nitrospira sp.]|nr:MAG: hypothetical protein LZF60_220053 [Nitrospira sp.]